MEKSHDFNIIQMHNSLNLFVEYFWKIENYYHKKPQKRDVEYNINKFKLHAMDDRYNDLLSLFYFEFWTIEDLLKPPTIKVRREFIVKYIKNYGVSQNIN